jgi:hypothetical protein
MGEPLFNLIASALTLFILGNILLAVLRWLDRLGRTPVKVDGVLVTKWTLPTGRQDHNLNPLDRAYARVRVDEDLVLLARIREGDFESFDKGTHVKATVVTGWSGRKYALDMELAK